MSANEYAMSTLSELARNKNNNFNLIRLTAALAVLIGHCFPLATGKEANLWMGNHLGVSLGSIAVDIFFVTSGFLVTGSLLSSKNTIRFIQARILRIYPALIIMLIFTTIFIGGYFTSLHLADYLANQRTFWYLLKNGSLITGAAYTLPGVFETNPYKSAINGSLWTMPYEIWLYGLLALIWVTLSAASRSRLRIFKIIIVILALSALSTFSYIEGNTNYYQFVRLSSMFFSGAAYFVLQKRIIFTPTVIWLSIIALAASTLDIHAFKVVYNLLLPYLLLCAAYIPSGRILSFNRIGDYSYGVYIYAFPIQQSVAAFFPGITVTGMFQLSLSLTFLLAMLSWHFIEKPALALKGAPSARHSSRLT